MPKFQKDKGKDSSVYGRGNVPSDNSSKRKTPFKCKELPSETQDVLDKLRDGRGPAAGDHQTDPLTGHPAGPSVVVKEYYPHGREDSRRLVSRSQGSDARQWFYSPAHPSGSYVYHEITDLPLHAGSPLPTAVPLPSPPPIVAVHLPRPAALPTAPPPRRTGWDSDSD